MPSLLHNENQVIWPRTLHRSVANSYEQVTRIGLFEKTDDLFFVVSALLDVRHSP